MNLVNKQQVPAFQRGEKTRKVARGLVRVGVKPVRILPIWGFISGGIEFNFPIAHSPTSIAEVGCVTGQIGGYGFIRVGEREARTGMEWVVELGLAEGCAALVQRTAFRNGTGADHPWMSWTICAVRSTVGTEFVHPPHRVLVHDDRVVGADWPGEGLNWDRNAKQMTAFFWQPGSAPQFGVFHHDLGFGLMHRADPAQLPGKKVWTYGHGKHRHWGERTTEDGLSYCEIESGPLLDQSEKPMFPRGTERRHEEFWIPVHSRAACDNVASPNLDLPPMSSPWLGWKHSAWQTQWEKFRAGEGSLPASPVPTGLELESALRREIQRGDPAAAPSLALWLAFRGRPEEALALVEKSCPPPVRSDRQVVTMPLEGGPRAPRAAGSKDGAEAAHGVHGPPFGFRTTEEETLRLHGHGLSGRATVARTPPAPGAVLAGKAERRVAGLILWHGLRQPARALAHLESGPLHDPVAVVELDELYAELGLTDRRAALLASAPECAAIIERRADLALVTGRPEETIRLLRETAWPFQHQRYVRTGLWKRARAALGEPDTGVPDFLHEDNLAPFGAYWSD